MKLYVFVPGMLGSNMRQRHAPHGEIWPPGSVNAFQSRTFTQLTDDLIPDGIVEKVCVIEIYATIVDLFDQAGIKRLPDGERPETAFLPFPFDWRMSVQSEADRLASLLDELTEDGDEITIVAHSMGALLSRYLLESQRYAGRAFGERVVKWVPINGVLLGAPVMLARAMGLEPTQFVTWADTPRLLATPPLAGGYNLLPAPWEGRLFNEKDAIDIYNPYYQTAFHFGLENMRNTKAIWDEIAAGTRRDGVDYVLITSRLSDDSTIERVRYTNKTWVREFGPGDGLVPPWSSQGIEDATIPEPLAGSHEGVIHTQAFREAFSKYIAALPGAAPDPLLLQPLKEHLRPGSVANFAVVRQAQDLPSDGRLVWTAVNDKGVKVGAAVRDDGVAVPNQASPMIHGQTPDPPGNYDVTLTLGAARASTRVSVRPAAEQPITASTSTPPPAPPP